MLTKTNIEVDVEVAETKRGLVLLRLDGEAFPLTADDAEAIGKKLREAAAEAVR
jgi:hypothetical protein